MRFDAPKAAVARPRIRLSGILCGSVTMLPSAVKADAHIPARQAYQPRSRSHGAARKSSWAILNVGATPKAVFALQYESTAAVTGCMSSGN
jgi:hypothetical protein